LDLKHQWHSVLSDGADGFAVVQSSASGDDIDRMAQVMTNYMVTCRESVRVKPATFFGKYTADNLWRGLPSNNLIRL
jgi:hypothetical protein